ncbi:hypothetical protein [Kitasatospora herbaricolor]|uniref:hypothetical protein n=1 Tax=Kitasatospora herbaricolor TaxID=68217 RepID=UPI0036DA78EF
MKRRTALLGALIAVGLSLAAVVVPVAPQAAEAATIANSCSTGGTTMADSYYSTSLFVGADSASRSFG